MDHDRTRKPHWTDGAACRGMTMDQTRAYFFPEDDRSRIVKVSRVSLGGAVEMAEALFCGRCPVRVQCLEAALERGQEQYGIVAGTSPETRRALARTRSRVKCPQCAQQNPSRVITTVDGRPLVHQVCRSCGLSWTAEQNLAEAS